VAAIVVVGAILVAGPASGRIDGLRSELEPRRAGDAARRALAAGARRVLGPENPRRATALIAAPDEAFALDPQGRILWREVLRPAAIGKLLAGPTPLVPRLELLLADSLSGQAREAVRLRLARWLDAHLAAITLPLRRLQAAAGLDGAGRGLCFLLVEGLGNVRTPEARTLLKTLGGADRARLGRLGVRFGVRQIYLPAMLKPRAIDLRARLWATHRRATGLTAPPPGAVAFETASGLPKGFSEAIGFETLGSSCQRIDIVERLAARLRALARQGPFALEPELMAMTGLGAGQLADVALALGFEREGDRYVRGKTRRPSAAKARDKTDTSSPFAALRQMLVNP
jgi:ATP-dependent RNA helicase SUPV3L1/SUV3